MTYDVGIIGCGPSAMAAAIYLARANYSVLILEREAYGGQLMKSPCIENYPGFVGTGYELANAMYDQMTYPNIHLEFEEAVEVLMLESSFTIGTSVGGVYEVKKVIYAGGVEHKHLPCLQGEMEHVHYCATCDGPLYKDKSVAVIGDGNSALQYALELSNYCTSVSIITMFDKFFGESVLIDEVLKRPNIQWIKSQMIVKVEAEGTNKVRLIGLDKRYNIVDGVFVAIGQKPNLITLPTQVSTHQGYIQVNKNQESTVTGFYAVGDCTDKEIRQVSVAVAEGTIAALSIIKGDN